MDKQKAPWKLGSKQIPLYYLVTLAKSVCFRFSRSYSLSPFLNNLKFLLVSAKIITIKMCSLQNQLSILISIISSIFVIARPVYSNKWKLKWYKKWTNKKLHENWDQNKYLSIIWSGKMRLPLLALPVLRFPVVKCLPGWFAGLIFAGGRLPVYVCLC